MSRNLTPSQKRLLKEWFFKNYDGGYKFQMADNIDYDTYKAIEDLHPTEIHYQNVNNFLEDLVDKH
jgi:hypothetical protein